MESLDLQAFSYDHRDRVTSSLLGVFQRCGGWLHGHKPVSATQVEFRLEIQLRTIVEFYASLVESGIELTRPTHHALTDLCTRRKYRRISAMLGRTVGLRLVITFLDEPDLATLLDRSQTHA